MKFRWSGAVLNGFLTVLGNVLWVAQDYPKSKWLDQNHLMEMCYRSRLFGGDATVPDDDYTITTTTMMVVHVTCRVVC